MGITEIYLVFFKKEYKKSIKITFEFFYYFLVFIPLLHWIEKLVDNVLELIEHHLF